MFPPPVENLQHLILWSLLPGHSVETQVSGEPEDDLTPTPSVISITSHPWDPGSPGQAPTGDHRDNIQLPELERGQPEQEDMALCSLAHLPPRTRNSGIWESPELDRNPAEEVASTEAAGNYKVVRKGKMHWCVHREIYTHVSWGRGESCRWVFPSPCLSWVLGKQRRTLGPGEGNT
jgi:Rho guanine nucleotide exchange factor 11